MKGKPILCVDFDGVIHAYSKGWQKGEIYDTYVPGFFKWAIEAVKHFDLVIYSSRSKTEVGRIEMRAALGRWSIESVTCGEVSEDFEWPQLFDQISFASEKPPAFLTIDDRCIQFQGHWGGQFEVKNLRAFLPWNQR
jgi:hypothetical protein